MGGLLTRREVEAMRATVADMLPELCTVRTRSSTVDALGSEVVSWASTTNVPCRLSPAVQKNHSTEGERFNVHAGWVLVVRYDQALASGDQVQKDGKTYTVLAVNDFSSDRLLRRAYLRRVE